ncbi:MAG: ABC transporter substrate-binding protein [Mesorhizobium sp.]|uniref:ABC transporter substrate-binding protein n=1 Tax=Mesorhizobium sp. TaxID=1871066 RepID=UPI000FE4AC55|nr:ABC transporter substrate-binding protein [Mesorhizobium sp.]RWH46672.1 MAG: ABC transporter substrate-binding protein [Mesorhizobium sp.]
MTTTRGIHTGISAAVLAVGAMFFVGAASAQEVVVASYGGAFQDAQTKAYFEPYTKATGTKVTGTTGSGYAKVKAMVESGNVTWDVVSAESSAFANELKDGLLQPIDYSVVKADGIPAEFRKEYGVGYISFGQILAWNKDKFPNGVTPAQFFDPTVKARRVLTSDPYFTLENALMSDGVKAADLYPLDVDRAFKVIDRIKDQLIGFKGASDTQALIQQGEVDIAFGPNGRIADAIKAGANWAYSWEASVSDIEWWVVTKGAPNAEEAMKFINFAVQPEQQAELTRQIPYGPTNVDALKLLDPAVAKSLPSYPDNAALGIVLNAQWWHDNLETVKPRWDEYILQ